MSSNKPQIAGIDALLPLTRDNTDSFYTLSKNASDSIRQNIKMLFYTSPGERIMLPSYGIGLRNFLFEQTPEIDIINRINEQVEFFIPQITILQLSVSKPSEKDIFKTGQKNSLSVEILYQINGTNVRDSIKLVNTEPS